MEKKIGINLREILFTLKKYHSQKDNKWKIYIKK